MAYINKEETAKIRKAIKDRFPKIKFSITTENNTTLRVTIMKSDLFEGGEQKDYVLPNSKTLNEKQNDVIKELDQIIRTVGEYSNNSDIMTDYFDQSFYYYIGIGKWNKPHEFAG